MAYVNVRLPVGEGRAFKVPPYNKERSFRHLTINEEKDAVLLKGAVNRDEPYEATFYFYYKGKIFDMTLNGQEYLNHNTKIWKLRGISISSEFDKDEILSELREALKVYGYNGMCKEEQELWKRKFNQEDPNGFAVTDF